MIKEQELLNKAINCHQTGNYEGARSLYERILQQNPNNDKALYWSGILVYQLGRPDMAIELLKKAVVINPVYEYCKDLGNILFDLGLKDQALICFQKALEKNPNDAEIYFNSGVICQEKADYISAINCFENVLKLNPNDSEVYNAIGSIYYNNIKNIEKSVSYFESAVKINPNYMDAYFNLSLAYNAVNEKDKAINSYKQVLRLNPAHTSALFNIGILLAEKDQSDEAAMYFEKLIKLDSDNAQAYYNLGNLFNTKKNEEQAILYYKKAIELKPDMEQAYNNLGTILNARELVDEATDCFKKAIELKADYLDPYANLGDIYRYKNDLNSAKECYFKALSFDPDFAEANGGLGMAYISEGNFEEGWKHFEYRFYVKGSIKPRLPVTSSPGWDGQESLEGKTIFASHEQGLGDAIQFVRFLPLLHDKGAKVLYKPPSALVEFFKYNEPALKAEIIDSTVPDNEIECDFYIPLLSLTHAFKINSDNMPYRDSYLKADPDKVNFYKEKYFSNDKFKLGINWLCKNKFPLDYHRSLPDVSYLFGFTKFENVEVYSLHKGEGENELKNLPVNIINLGSTFNNFADTAAAVENLDLVITVDTSISHLAGALGKPTWNLLQFSPDWRWGLESETSYWYNKHRLFRQKEADNWNETINRALIEFKNLLE